MQNMSVSAGDRLLTAKDLQEIFQCGRNRAYELLHSHGFPAIKIGERYYIQQSALDHWMDVYSGRIFALENGT